jgi:catechol 2,3-dioxygenase-like lactoylglutathione lyase family enzyme
MHLLHLCLPVRDGHRSQDFYARYFGFAADLGAQPEAGEVALRNADGFELTLRTHDVVTLPHGLHFGFRTEDAGTVRACLARLAADKVPIAGHYEAPEKVAFQCVDPDGYRVEVYWTAAGAKERAAPG